MKFMIIGHATKDTEAGILPTGEEFAKMGKFQEELANAGVLVGGEGLHPTSRGSRITFGANGKFTVKDGPFTESKEIIAGFSIIQVKSREEAIAWMSRGPFPEGSTMEIRQLFTDEDFAPSDPTGELRAADDELRQRIEKQHGKG